MLYLFCCVSKPKYFNIAFYSENLLTEMTQRKHDFYSVIYLQIQEKARGTCCKGLGEGCRLSHAGEILGGFLSCRLLCQGVRFGKKK